MAEVLASACLMDGLGHELQLEGREEVVVVLFVLRLGRLVVLLDSSLVLIFIVVPLIAEAEIRIILQLLLSVRVEEIEIRRERLRRRFHILRR